MPYINFAELPTIMYQNALLLDWLYNEVSLGNWTYIWMDNNTQSHYRMTASQTIGVGWILKDKKGAYFMLFSSNYTVV